VDPRFEVRFGSKICYVTCDEKHVAMQFNETLCGNVLGRCLVMCMPHRTRKGYFNLRGNAFWF